MQDVAVANRQNLLVFLSLPPFCLPSFPPSLPLGGKVIPRISPAYSALVLGILGQSWATCPLLAAMETETANLWVSRLQWRAIGNRSGSWEM